MLHHVVDLTAAMNELVAFEMTVTTGRVAHLSPYIVRVDSAFPIQSAVAQEPAASFIILLAKMRANGQCGSEPYAACLGFTNKRDCVHEFTSVLDGGIASIGSPDFLDFSAGEALSQCMIEKSEASPFLSKQELCKDVLGNASRGRRRSATCAACHGKDGNSMVESNPSLAGLNESYLIRAMQDYRSGIRTNVIMIAFTKTLSEEDIRDLAAYYKRYCRSLGLSSLPAPNESGPLVVKQRGRGPITSSRQIRLIVQNCFDAAFERMRVDGLESDAETLREATAHWLRHKGISEDVKTRPREHVRE